MKLQTWRSFSANNSSSAYIVGRFASPPEAESVRQELAAYLQAHQEQLAAMTPRERGANRDMTMATLEFSDAHGIDWPSQIAGGYADDEDLELQVLDRTLVVYHDYCLGLGDELTQYLRGRGATIEANVYNKTPEISILAKRSGHDKEDAAFALLLEILSSEGIESSFQTRSSFGIRAATAVDRLGEVREALSELGASDFIATLDDATNPKRFAAVAEASCSGCGAAELDFLPVDFFDVPTDQLVCVGCGAMYDLPI